MPSNHLILCLPLLLSPSVFLSIRIFSGESALRIRWPKYWSFSFSISHFNEYSGLTSFRIDWFDLLAVQGTLKSLLQRHSVKASILGPSALFMVPLSHPYMLTWKTMRACVLSRFSRVRLFATMDCSPPGSSVQGILQARILEWVAISSSRRSSQPRDRAHISDLSCTGRWVLYCLGHPEKNVAGGKGAQRGGVSCGWSNSVAESSTGSFPYRSQGVHMAGSFERLFEGICFLVFSIF